MSLEKTITAIVDGIREELEINAESIQDAMAKNDGKVTISCPIEIDGQPHSSGAQNKIKVSMSWVMDRRKVEIKDTVYEGQAEMEFGHKGAGGANR